MILKQKKKIFSCSAIFIITFLAAVTLCANFNSVDAKLVCDDAKYSGTYTKDCDYDADNNKLECETAVANSKFFPDCACQVTCTRVIADCGAACACQSEKETPVTIQHITDEFIFHRRWLIKMVWEAHVLPALMLMTEQISAMAVQQMMIVGTFFDAKHQLETQRLLQEMQADAHKKFHPSEGMCQFGTNMRALAASDHKTGLNQTAISTRIQSRSLLSGDGISGSGSRDESRSRMATFKQFYCNSAEIAGAMAQICNNNDAERINRDIDVTSIMDRAKTLDIDYGNPNITKDETDILALATNLYGENLFPYIPEEKMATAQGAYIQKGASAYMDIRALLAKRSVAEAAYAAQLADRTPGTGNGLPYMISILEEMGFTEEQAIELLGEKPSYRAQMDLLAKMLYQTPNFYTELYDKPANVDRKIVSMQAIALMQQRDKYRSSLRREAIESVMLETMLHDLEQEMINNARATSSNNLVLDNLRGLD